MYTLEGATRGTCGGTTTFGFAKVVPLCIGYIYECVCACVCACVCVGEREREEEEEEE